MRTVLKTPTTGRDRKVPPSCFHRAQRAILATHYQYSTGDVNSRSGLVESDDTTRWRTCGRGTGGEDEPA
jgi:hypothetical protein